MKDWLDKHKLYVLAVLLIAFGGIYYFFVYETQPGISPSVSVVENDFPVEAKEGEETNQHQTTFTEPEKIIVDVKGQVQAPGVYQSSQGERVIDVITRAGGLTEKADESQVNFAEHVQDAMVIYIPAKGEEGQAAGSPSGGNFAASDGSTGSKETKINLNKADVTELQNLPGIGPAKASAIIEFRETNGPFKAIEDLKNISGIGDKTFEKLKEFISVR